MRAVIAFGALALVLAAPAAAANLRLVSPSPLTVRGQGFEPRETVLVMVTAGRQRAERRVRAAADGTFVAAFRLVTVNGRCAGYVVRALGSRGSLATLRSPPLRCPPRPKLP